MDPSLQQLHQFFQDEDNDGILAMLADLESQGESRKNVDRSCEIRAHAEEQGQEFTANVTPVPKKETSSTINDSKAGNLSKPTGPFFYYKDYSRHPDPDPNTPITVPGRIPNFPAKMYAILSRPDFQHIISWMPHGRSWKVHKPRELEVKVLPSYFEHSKFSSFIRQANGWGFRRITSKCSDRSSYYHEMFLRSVPHVIKLMKRPPPSTKPLADASTEPDLCLISEMFPLPEEKVTKGCGDKVPRFQPNPIPSQTLSYSGTHTEQPGHGDPFPISQNKPYQFQYHDHSQARNDLHYQQFRTSDYQEHTHVPSMQVNLPQLMRSNRVHNSGPNILPPETSAVVHYQVPVSATIVGVHCPATYNSYQAFQQNPDHPQEHTYNHSNQVAMRNYEHPPVQSSSDVICGYQHNVLGSESWMEPLDVYHNDPSSPCRNQGHDLIDPSMLFSVFDDD